MRLIDTGIIFYAHYGFYFSFAGLHFGSGSKHFDEVAVHSLN
jgi:hypothetical protein